MNAIRLKHVFSATAACVLLGLATSALAQFIWLDEKGVKQYSDMPPPASVPSKRILKAPGQHLARGAGSQEAGNDTSDDAATDAKAAPAAPPTIAEQDAAYQKRKAEQAEKNKKAAQEAKQASDKAENCARARANQRTLDSGTRIAQTDANGQRSYMNDDQRAKQNADNRAVLNDCQ
jgi:type IV secretory pathway VirB10-like protein